MSTKSDSGIPIEDSNWDMYVDPDTDELVFKHTGTGSAYRLDPEGTVRLPESTEMATIEAGSQQLRFERSRSRLSIRAQKAIDVSAPEVTIDAETDLSLSSKGELTASGAAKTTVTAQGQLEMKSSGPADLESSGILNLKGALINLN